MRGGSPALREGLNEMKEIKEGDIVQITDENHHWFPCLIIVSEVKGFGVQGYITMPTNDKEPNGNAFIRLNTDQFDFIGMASVKLND